MSRAGRCLPVALGLWALASTAAAGWVALSVEGVPYDAEVSEDGSFAVATSTGAYGFDAADGEAPALIDQHVGPRVAAFWLTPGCLASFELGGGYADCDGTSALAEHDIFALARDVTGHTWVSTSDSAYLGGDRVVHGPSALGPWNTDANTVPDLADVVAAARIDGTSYGLFGTRVLTTQPYTLELWSDGGFVTLDTTSNELRALAIASLNGDPMALAAGAEGVFEVPLSGGTFAPLVELPDHVVTGIDTLTLGDGKLGLLAVQGAEGGLLTLTPSPGAPTDSASNLVVPAAALPSHAGLVTTVRCGGAVCLVLTDADGAEGANVLIYENRAPPDWLEGPVLELREDEVMTFEALADPDGDLLFVDWSPPPGGEYTLTPLDGGSIELAYAGADDLCGEAPFDYPLSVTARDWRSDNTVDLVGKVRVAPVMTPLGETPPTLAAAYEPLSATVGGTVALGLDCAEERGLEARVEVKDPAGASLSGPEVVSLPGEFELAVPQACGSADLQLSATVLTEEGPAGTAVWPFATPALAAGLAAPELTELPMACGEPLSVAVSVEDSPGACPRSVVRWTQVDGPQVDAPELEGRAVLLSASGSLDELLGRDLVFDVEADGGPGNVYTARHAFTVVADPPFVEVDRLVVPAQLESGEIVTIAVVVTNPTACDVSEVSVRERLDGLRWVEGSVRVDSNEWSDARLVDGELEVGGLSLPAGGSVVVAYAARMPLLGSPEPRSAVYAHGVPISSTDALLEPAPLGCACGAGGSGGSGGALALSLLGALTLLRRATRARRGL